VEGRADDGMIEAPGAYCKRIVGMHTAGQRTVASGIEADW